MKKYPLFFTLLSLLFTAGSFAQMNSGELKLPETPGTFSPRDLRAISLTDSSATVQIASGIAPSLIEKRFPDVNDFFRDRDYYLRKSKRQKRTGWIILGSGLALITTGIVVAAENDDDAIAAGVSLVLISGTGLVTSLVSIPFFVASARNKRIAMRLTSAIELQKMPVLVGRSVYPGVSFKISW